MKFAKTLTAAAVCSLFALGNAHAVSAPEDISQIFGDFIPTTDPDDAGPLVGHAGPEVAVPFFKVFDDNVDGYPESIQMMWKVYAPESGALLRTTPAKTITVANGGLPDPTSCSGAPGLESSIRFARREDALSSVPTLTAGSQRAHFGVNLEMNGPGCFGKSAIVFSGNLSGVTGATGGGMAESWLRVYPGRELLGLNGVDTNGDLIFEALMITTHVEVATGENVVIQFINAGANTDFDPDGGGANPAWPARTYPLSRIQPPPAP